MLGEWKFDGSTTILTRIIDIFMTPKAIPNTTPTIPMSKLAAHTGHRKGSRMWIGVHGGVYDVTGLSSCKYGSSQR